MIDENEKILKLSIPNNFNIVIFTQNSLRHKRFALRLQQEFGNKVVAWFEILPNKDKKNLEDSNRQKLFNKIKKHFANIKSIILRTKTIVYKPSFGLMKYLSLISHRINNLFLGVSAIWQFYFISRKFNSIERSILYDEINELKRFKIIDPEIITDPTSDKFIEKVKKTFLLIFCYL